MSRPRAIKVSYCTTCHGRLWQLALTLFDNLERLRPDEELVLLDYGSPDGLSRFVESSRRCRKAIEQGRLVYTATDAPSHHSPKAKNLAHRLARGVLLVNLDADNSNRGMRRVIDRCFARGQDNRILHMVAGLRDGSYGRICIPRQWFYRLGGYDESFLPTGHQDTDLLDRAKAMGLRYVAARTGAPAPLQNTIAERIAYTGQLNRGASNFDPPEEGNGHPGAEMEARLVLHTNGLINRRTSELNLKKARLVANPHGWGAAVVRINFGAPEPLAPMLPPLISMVLLSTHGPKRMNELLEQYNRMPLVGEILLVNKNPKFPIETTQREDSKVIVMNSGLDRGNFSRFSVASLATFPAVLLTDDDVFLPEQTLAELYQGWCRDPSILHGVNGKNVRSRAVSNGAGLCEIVPTKGVLTTVSDCVRSLAYTSSLSIDGRLAKSRRLEDILLSSVVAAKSGRPNMNYRLPIKTLPPASTAGRTPAKSLTRQELALLRWCRQNVSVRASDSLNIVVDPAPAAAGNSRTHAPLEDTDVFAGPWVGEFGWELCWWNPLIRFLAQDYGRVTVAAPESSRYLYEFADDFIPLQTEGRRFIQGRLRGPAPQPALGAKALTPEALWHEFGTQEFDALNTGAPVITPKKWRPLGASVKGEKVADILCAFRPAKVMGQYRVPGKEYPLTQCEELVALLLNAGLSVACYGGKDNYWFENTIDLRGLPLGAQCSALSSAKCAVGPSSAPLHLASLCQCPHVTWSRIRPDIAIRYQTHWNPFRVPIFFMERPNPSPCEIAEGVLKFVHN